jgi:hypothetical protein
LQRNYSQQLIKRAEQEEASHKSVKEKEESELKGCVFKPKLNRKSAQMMKNKVQAGSQPSFPGVTRNTACSQQRKIMAMKQRKSLESSKEDRSNVQIEAVKLTEPDVVILESQMSTEPEINSKEVASRTQKRFTLFSNHKHNSSTKNTLKRMLNHSQSLSSSSRSVSKLHSEKTSCIMQQRSKYKSRETSLLSTKRPGYSQIHSKKKCLPTTTNCQKKKSSLRKYLTSTQDAI